MSDVIDVANVIENQRRNTLVLTVVILSTAIMFLDGYDLQAMAFAAPSIVRSWGIDRAALGIVFSAGIFGIMVGGLGTMAPERRDEINSLGLKSIVSGTLTTCLMGAIVGVLT